MSNLVIKLPDELTRRDPAEQVLDAFDGPEFCRRYMISLPFLYVLWKRGEGPRSFKVGGKRLISREAAEQWRREREAATAAEESPEEPETA